ncbi:hypothetical protein [Cereibacter sphaeroides]|uniref:hypothetical protein n=1 Tax=Cereibacter sphaeroides TaxID=1063 RepID=UPI001F3D190A|nr:hypothetical protein [Cereibacter sphaeroides]MCE6968053.1 hypothetical protein [Cereibacter sphaeroides]
MTTNQRPARHADLVRTPHVPEGWALPALVRLEAEADRRLIGPLSVASSDRRSAAFAVLAALRDGETAPPALVDMTPQALVERLLTAIPRALIEAAYGAVPALAATIFKTHGDPLATPEDYARIASMLTGSTHRAQRQSKCLIQSQRVTSDFLRTLDLLRDAYLRPAVVAVISRSETARQVEQVTGFLMQACPLLPEHVLAHSLEQRGAGNLRQWAVRMLLRHAYDICDLEDDADLTFLRTADDFQSLAQKYRNCLADERGGKIMNAALGLTAYAEWRHAPVIVELIRMHDGETMFWACEALWGIANDRLPKRLEQDIRARLRQRGIRSLALMHRPGLDSEVAERLADVDPVGYLWFREAD